MNSKKAILGALVAVGLLGVSVQTSSAAVVASCALNSGLSCIVNGPDYGSGNSGNDKEESVEAALADALGIASLDLTLLGKSDAGYGSAASGKSGSWSTPDAVAYFTVKAANSYIIYDGFDATSGSWSTMGILNKGGQQPDVSHISYWTTGIATAPLPAAAWMLIAAVGGLVAMRRRKNA